MKKTPKWYKQYTDDIFKNAQDFQQFLRAGKNLNYDYVIIDNILYTQEEYDQSGHIVIWSNRKHKKQMSVETSNRYSLNGYKDAKVTIYSATSWREDITYAE